MQFAKAASTPLREIQAQTILPIALDGDVVQFEAHAFLGPNDGEEALILLRRTQKTCLEPSQLSLFIPGA